MQKLNKFSGVVALIAVIIAIISLALSGFSLMQKAKSPTFNRNNMRNFQQRGNFNGGTGSSSSNESDTTN